MRVYVEPTVDVAKVKATIYYLEAIKAIRLIVMLIAVLLFVVTMFGAGLVLIPIGLVIWAPWTLETKLLVALIIGGVYLLVPIIGVRILMSEARWMRLTRADKLVHTVLQDQAARH